MMLWQIFCSTHVSANLWDRPMYLYEITSFYYYSTLNVDERSENVKVHIAKTLIHASDGSSINLQDQSTWRTMKTFGEGYGFVGVVHLSPSSEARYVVVSRNDDINLKEVQVYQNTC